MSVLTFHRGIFFLYVLFWEQTLNSFVRGKVISVARENMGRGSFEIEKLGMENRKHSPRHNVAEMKMEANVREKVKMFSNSRER